MTDTQQWVFPHSEPGCARRRRQPRQRCVWGKGVCAAKAEVVEVAARRREFLVLIRELQVAALLVSVMFGTIHVEGL